MVTTVIFLLLLSSAMAQNQTGEGPTPEPDPCRSALYYTDTDLRSVQNKVEKGGEMRCDIRMDQGWYRFQGEIDGHLATMDLCKYARCGTAFPICLQANETHPEVDDGVVERTVCVKKPSKLKCHGEAKVFIKNCGTYDVYYLVPPITCPASYCVREVKCKPDMCSPTGFEPGCSACDEFVSVGTLTVTVFEQLEPFDDDEINSMVFRCQFNVRMDKPTVTYDIHWYLDNIQVAHFPNLQNHELEKGLLKEEHWVDFPLHTEVKCAVRTRFPNGNPGGYQRSKPYFAGLEVNGTEVVVKEGERAILYVRSTVPLPYLKTDDIEVGEYEIFVTSPTYQTTDVCKEEGVPRVIFDQNTKCGVKLYKKEYHKWQPLYITGVLDNRIATAKLTFLRLSVMLETHQHPERRLWKGYRLKDIKVLITNIDVNQTGRECYSRNDPHMKSGDGKPFELHQEGEYIFYRHKNLPVAVHLKFQSCTYWSSYYTNVTCNCGIALRAYNNLVLIDRCQNNNQFVLPTKRTYMNYENCDDQHIALEQTSDLVYMFKLPTGAVVIVDLGGKIGISYVTMKLAYADIDHTEGLCGEVSQNRTQDDDFTMRNGQITRDPQEFSRDWKVQSEAQSYFNKDIKLENYMPLRIYCTCKKEETTSKRRKLDRIENEVFCNYDIPATQCQQKLASNTQYKAFIHRCGERTARDEGNRDDLDDGPSGWQSDLDYEIMRARRMKQWEELQKRQEPAARKWTKAAAYEHCHAAFKNSAAVAPLMDASGLSTNASVENCVLDILATDETIYTAVSVESFKTSAREEFLRNEVLVESPAGRVLREELKVKDCRNDCSGHGKCNNSVCLCVRGYAGSDCSIDISKPPSNITIPKNKCNKCKNACKLVSVLADGIPDNSPVYCGLEMFEVSEKEEFSLTTLPPTIAEPWAPGQVNCPLSNRRPGISVTRWGFHISLSNDNQTFSKKENYTIMDCLI